MATRQLTRSQHVTTGGGHAKHERGWAANQAKRSDVTSRPRHANRASAGAVEPVAPVAAPADQSRAMGEKTWEKAQRRSRRLIALWAVLGALVAPPRQILIFLA
ncbi:hypothetical protein DV737_g4010, partial [Chaetothyriales sp. CBS 132003]